ncbi:3-oxoacyl-[acyl-carrier-protein] reductase [Pseudohyphozyma bogoriensis]|nr:3-oxoacyl-[acyl-carrier-protein] reductase [Pseudohyphozyma bogoriensis]
MPGKLAGQVAIVTGGALGLGDGIVTKFLAEDCKCVILDWNVSSLEDKPARENVKVVQGDVSKPEAWQKALAAAKEFGKLTTVVNNAGIVSRDTRATHEADITELDRLLTVNLKGLFVSVQSIVPYFLENKIRGSFVNITSASKAAAEGATKSFAIEYAPQGIRFNGVAPVIANTQMAMSLTGGVPDEARLAQMAASIPLGRIAQPSDIANMVAHLACEESSFITGQIVAADGGRCI